MTYLPLNINVQNRPVLVVGGGAVAGRKIISLLNAGAAVNIVAPEFSDQIGQLSANGDITVKVKYYDSSDLADNFLVVAATNDPQTNRTIAADARQRGILVTVADVPTLGNCTFPAVLRRGDLEISISTGGKCPGFALEIRDLIGDIIGDEYGKILETVAVEREKLLTEGNPSTYNTTVLRSRTRELISQLIIHKERVP